MVLFYPENLRRVERKNDDGLKKKKKMKGNNDEMHTIIQWLGYSYTITNLQ